ncbi:hypothetical protein [Scrofimicrobium sp. R131]|uniref:Uncharacterized protein n=1 Tax=Scrofimicrobium appendicitidis TaxID=3079930 RepID=A0AAU7V6T9_9ACTO
MAGTVTPSMWVRRIISLLVLALLVAGVGYGVFQVGRSVYAKLTEHKETVLTPEQNLPVQIAACAAKDLRVDFQPDVYNPPVGEGFSVAVTIENRGTGDCSFDTGQLAVRLVTGEDVVWTPTACSSNWARPLLLSPDQNWTGTLKWDGHIYSECAAVTNDSEEPLVAGAGTYRLLGFIGEEALPGETRVELS